MTDTIKALQDEIETIQKLLKEPRGEYTRQWLMGYQDGIKAAINLLEKEQSLGLPY